MTVHVGSSCWLCVHTFSYSAKAQGQRDSCKFTKVRLGSALAWTKRTGVVGALLQLQSRFSYSQILSSSNAPSLLTIINRQQPPSSSNFAASPPLLLVESHPLARSVTQRRVSSNPTHPTHRSDQPLDSLTTPYSRKTHIYPLPRS